MTAVSRVAVLVLVVFCSLAAGTAAAQDFPSKPIRFIISPAPDVLPRLVGQKLAEIWGQQVIVDQHPGAGGIIAAEMVARAAADGYTWLMSTGAYPTLVALRPKLPFDFVRDLAPVSLMATIPFLLVVHPSLPVKSLEELLGFARARPGQLNYASGGTGTTGHLATELFKNMAGINIVHVPYKSVAAAVLDLTGGQVHMMLTVMQGALPHVQAGKLRALAVSATKRSAAAPEVPTIAESGVPGYEFISWNAVHVPAATPKAVIATIHRELARVLALPEMRERMFKLGMEPAGGTPEELGALVNSDIAKWRRVIKESNVRVD